MSRVRELRASDVAWVAELWARKFRRRAASLEGVRRRFHSVFLDGPLAGDGVHALVYEDDAGPSGFIGAFPRRMSFRGRPIRVAVATQLMVEPGPGRAFAAFDLVRALFAGPQDFTWSDGANEAAQGVWERMGGEVALLYSIDWTRVLKPASFARARLERSGRAGRALGVAAPLCWTVDACAARLPIGPFTPPRTALSDEQATEDEISALIAAEPQALKPAYGTPSLAWHLRGAADNRAHGSLAARVCRGASGDAVGWYVAYVSPGGVTKVLQIGGAQKAIPGVLDALFATAWRAGSVAVSGQVDPRILRELTDAHCDLACKSLGVLVHSRHPELLAAVHRGDAMLTRLDGEWWLGFDGDAPHPRADRRDEPWLAERQAHA